MLKKIIILFLFLLLSGCLQEKIQNNVDILNSSDSTGGNLNIIGIIHSNPLGSFSQEIQKIDSSTLNYNVRSCTYTEQSIYSKIKHPMVSIHSLENTPDLNMPLVVVYENTDDYVETQYAPLIELLLRNDTDKNTGKISFLFDIQQEGDIIFMEDEIISFGDIIIKSPNITIYDENYMTFSDRKYYFYDQNNNLVFIDTTSITDKKDILNENEISLDNLNNVIKRLCDSSLDYVVVKDIDNNDKKVVCEKSFKTFEIDNLAPKEYLFLSIYYFPLMRTSFEQKYPLDPYLFWPLKNKENGKYNIKINATYPNNQTEELLHLNLTFDLNEYFYDDSLNYCVLNSELT